MIAHALRADNAISRWPQPKHPPEFIFLSEFENNWKQTHNLAPDQSEDPVGGGLLPRSHAGLGDSSSHPTALLLSLMILKQALSCI